MQRDFTVFIKKNKLFSGKDKLLVAVSGGIDSIVLLDLLQKQGNDLAVAHCNFSLRGKESNKDEAFVKKLCKNRKLTFYSEKFDTLNYAEKKGISIQMAARELRYTWFENLRKQLRFDFVVTAHHKTDIAETILINLLRGTGIAGLHGILPKKNYLIRPLLFARKTDIQNYASAQELEFRNDSSNAETDYMRNKIRHWVLPELLKINPDFEQAFYETSLKLGEAEQVYKTAVDLKRNELEIKSKSEVRFAISDLIKLKPLSLFLFEFLSQYNFSAALCADIVTCLDREVGTLFYSKTHRLLIDRECIIITPLAERNVQDSFFIVSEKIEQKLPIQLNLTQKKISKNFQLVKAKHIAQLDAERLTFPLEIRRWKSGDSFYPLGMKGKKNLSDFFIDSKLSIFEKEKIWLLCSDKKIVWVINHRLDDRFKITSDTKKILQIEYLET